MNNGFLRKRTRVLLSTGSKIAFSCFMLALIAFSGTVFAAAQAEAAKQETITLTYATSLDEKSAYYAGAVALKEAAERLSGGRIQIKIYANAVLGTDRDMIQGMQLGSIDMASPSTGAMGSIVPKATVLDLPFLFTSYNHAYSVLDGPIGQEMIYKLFDGSGFHPLGYWEIGFRSLTNGKRPVQTPADVKGLRLRTLPSAIQQRAWTLVGAQPVAIDFTELYNALQTGVVDGQENPANIIIQGKLYEVQKYLSLTEHVYQVAPTSISDKTWAKLTPELQQILREAVAISTVAQRKAASGDVQGQLEEIKNAGVEINYTPNRAAFRDAMMPAWDMHLKEYPENQAIIDAIKAIAD